MITRQHYKFGRRIGDREKVKKAIKKNIFPNQSPILKVDLYELDGTWVILQSRERGEREWNLAIREASDLILDDAWYTLLDTVFHFGWV